MKNILEERRLFYYDSIADRLMPDLKKLDPIELRKVNEVLDTIALGCCLKTPRIFKNGVGSAEFFRAAARDITFDTICAVVQAIADEESRQAIHNRMWYIMGIIIRIKPQEMKPNRNEYNHFGHTQRTYSPEELRSIVKSIGEFSEDDL